MWAQLQQQKVAYFRIAYFSGNSYPGIKSSCNYTSIVKAVHPSSEDKAWELLSFPQ